MQITSIGLPAFSPAAINRLPGTPAQPGEGRPAPASVDRESLPADPAATNSPATPAAIATAPVAVPPQPPAAQPMPQPDEPRETGPPMTHPPRGPGLPLPVTLPPIMAAPDSVGPRLVLPNPAESGKPEERIKETGSETRRSPMPTLSSGITVTESPDPAATPAPAVVGPPVSRLGIRPDEVPGLLHVTPYEGPALDPAAATPRLSVDRPVMAANPAVVPDPTLIWDTLPAPDAVEGGLVHFQPILPNPATIGGASSPSDPAQVGFPANPAEVDGPPGDGFNPALVANPQKLTDNRPAEVVGPAVVRDSAPSPDSPGVRIQPILPNPAVIGQPGASEPDPAAIGRVISPQPDPAEIGGAEEAAQKSAVTTSPAPLLSSASEATPMWRDQMLKHLLSLKAYGEKAPAQLEPGPEAPASPEAPMAIIPDASEPIAQPEEAKGAQALLHRQEAVSSAQAADGTKVVASVARVETIEAVRQLVERIVSHTKDFGTSHVSFRLSPPELGEIKLQITNTGGRIEVRAEALTWQVKTMLLAGQNDLREQLAGHGLNLESLHVMVQDHQRRDFANEAPWSGRRLDGPAAVGATWRTETESRPASLRFFMASRYIDGLY